MKTLRKIIFALALISVQHLDAQEIIRPMPQSMIFEKFIDQEVSECSGTPEITIPFQHRTQRNDYSSIPGVSCIWNKIQTI